MDTFGSWHPPSSLETLPRDRDAHSAHLIRTMAAGVGRWQQVREAQQYKANMRTPLWTWAWGQVGTRCPPQHIRVNIPIHTVNVEEMLARWQRHPEVSSATWHWRQYKEAGGHYSFNDLDVRFFQQRRGLQRGQHEWRPARHAARVAAVSCSHWQRL